MMNYFVARGGSWVIFDRSRNLLFRRDDGQKHHCSNHCFLYCGSSPVVMSSLGGLWGEKVFFNGFFSYILEIIAGTTLSKDKGTPIRRSRANYTASIFALQLSRKLCRESNKPYGPLKTAIRKPRNPYKLRSKSSTNLTMTNLKEGNFK